MHFPQQDGEMRESHEPAQKSRSVPRNQAPSGPFLGKAAATRIARGRFRTAATASYYRTDGYMTVHPDRRGDVDRPIRDVNATVGARLEYQPSAGTVWSLGGGYYGEDQDWGTPLSVTRIDAGYLHGGGIVDTAGGGRWQVTGFLNRQGGANVSPSVAPDRQSETIAADQFDMPATAAGSSVQWSRPIGTRQLLTAGADAQVIDTTVSERFNFVAGQLTRTRELGGRQAFGGVFVEDIVQVTPAWRLVVAARVDRWRAYDGRRLETDIASQAVLRDETFPDRTAWRVSPSAGVVHHVSERISLKASVYRAFRAPTPSELSRPFRARGNVVTESNPRLDPERLTGIEGGVDAFLAAGLRTRITGFWDRLQDPVTQVTIDTAETGRTIPPCGFVPAGGVCRQRQNLGWLQSRGVESAIEYRRSPRWTLSAHWLFNPSRVVAAPDQPQLVGAFNKQSPVHQVTATAAYDDPRAVRVSALGRFVGRRFEDDLNSLPLDGFFVADLHVSRPVSSKAELYLSIQNLFDRTVQTTRASDGTIGIGAPRLVNAGLRVRF